MTRPLAVGLTTALTVLTVAALAAHTAGDGHPVGTVPAPSPQTSPTPLETS